MPFFQDVLEFGTCRQLELFTIIGKIAMIQDVLEFGTRRQLELFTIIGKIAIIQDVLEFGTHVQLHVPVQYGCTCLLLYNTRRILQLYTACTVHTTGTGVLQSHTVV